MFMNLTPHAIRVQYEDGDFVVFEASGTVATVAAIQQAAAPAGAFPCTVRTFGAVQNLPAPQEGVTLIVSSRVLDRCAGRTDVVAPDTGDNSAIRKDGQVWAVQQLVRPAPNANEALALKVLEMLHAEWEAGNCGMPGWHHGRQTVAEFIKVLGL